MAEDIAPRMLADFEEDFRKSFQSDSILRSLYARINAGKATQADAQQFVIELGRLTADVFHRNVKAEDLPDGKLYYNIASRIIPPILEQNYGITCDVMAQVIDAQNRQAGIGIKFQRPEFDEQKSHELAWVASQAEQFADVQDMVANSLGANARDVSNECVKKNADFGYDAGFSPKIVRDDHGGCCEWCASMAGTYDLKSAPKDVWATHANCTCTIEYDPGRSKRRSLSVSGKRWSEETERARANAVQIEDDRSPAKLEARKMIAGLRERRKR
jgi:hypothetical protein